MHQAAFLRISAAVCILAAVFLTACAAGTRNPSTWRGADTHFRQLDKNNDGRLTMDEINPDLALYQQFTRYDVDGSGEIELDEFYAYVRDREGEN